MRLAGAVDRAFTTDEIAREFQISRDHLSKVVQELSRAGYLRTQRGASGGMRLAKTPDKITLGEIVSVLESKSALVECFRSDGGGCNLTPRCRLKSKLAAARAAFLQELDVTTLAECAYPVQRSRQRS